MVGIERTGRPLNKAACLLSSRWFRVQQFRLLGVFLHWKGSIMDASKLINAIESAKCRILANISPKTLKEITDAIKKEAEKKSQGNRESKLRHPDGRA